jgi:hypothetical protein
VISGNTKVIGGRKNGILRRTFSTQRNFKGIKENSIVLYRNSKVTCGSFTVT